jgi:hypothetical protein
LLDAALIAENPARLEAYYAAMEGLDRAAVQQAVGAMAARPAPNLAEFIRLFSRERFLSDYADDAKLLVRLNQVMRRVGLPLLPVAFRELLADARGCVTARAGELLAA